MLDKGDRVLLCVSGGPDSVFLVYAFSYLAKEFGLRLFIANLDHGIRGKESREDSQFVKVIAKRFRVKLFTKSIKLKKNKKYSVEETARLKRYEFFYSVATRNRINKVATGHTTDDQAETVMMRIIKGTSMKGISGIPPVRRQGRITYIRPLLEMEKRDILEFLKKGNIRYKIDRTNQENKYFRNVVRNRVIPYLEKYNPQLKRSLSNLADTLREDREFLESKKIEAQKSITHDRGSVILRMKDIVTQPTAIQKEIARDAVMHVGGNIKKFTFRHWKEIQLLIKAMPQGKSLDLPGNVKLAKKKGFLHFEKKSKAQNKKV